MINREPKLDSNGNSRWRTHAEISEAEQECFDLRWYDRHISMLEKARFRGVPADILEGATAGADRIEEQHGKENLGPYTDFEWGVLTGRHYALRWMMGGEWSNGDT